jgi:hypothetical protein
MTTSLGFVLIAVSGWMNQQPLEVIKAITVQR